MTIKTATNRVAVMTAVLAVAAPVFAQRTAQQLVSGAMDNAQPPAKGATPPPAPAPASSTSSTPQPAAKGELPAPPPNFEYSPQGRRDPFLSLLARGDDGRSNNGEATKKRLEGVPGIMTGELFVRGIMQSRGGWVAMVGGADKKIYTVHAGDKLADGVIRQITANSVVILQEVNDPLSLEKQREVRKFLRGGDEVK
jgi:Tfp pilus assembly protein PilP